MDRTQEYSNSLPKSGKKKKSIADIVFLLDASSYMSPCIKALKNNIKRFIDTLSMPDANQDIKLKYWRISICTYRDYTYDPKYGVPAFERMPFSCDREEIHNYISSIEAKGGGPEAAESLLDALYEVISIGSVKKGEAPTPDMWRYRDDATRHIIIFTATPYREEMTTWPGGTFNDIEDLIWKGRFRIVLFAPEMNCYEDFGSINRAAYEVIGLNGKTPVEAMNAFVSDNYLFDKSIEYFAKIIWNSPPIRIAP